MANIYINVAEGRTGSRRRAGPGGQQPAGPAAEHPPPAAQSRGARPPRLTAAGAAPRAARAPGTGTRHRPAPALPPVAREEDAGGAVLSRSGGAGAAGPSAAGHPVPAPVGAALEPQPGPVQRPASAQGFNGLALLWGNPALAAPGKAQRVGSGMGRAWQEPRADLQLVPRAPASTAPGGRGTETSSRPTSWAGP